MTVLRPQVSELKQEWMEGGEIRRGESGEGRV